MKVSQKQWARLSRLVAELKENRYPNCTSFSKKLRDEALAHGTRLTCTPKTVQRDINILKNEYDAPIWTAPPKVVTII